jgi:hypothetical protein
MDSQGAYHRRRGAPLATGAALAAVLLTGTASAQARYETRLSSVADDLSTRDNVLGEGRARASLDGDQLTVSGEYKGLPSNATGAELRQGYAIGAPSDQVVGPLQVSGGQQGTLMYVQIKSEKAPDGNLWGWLLPPRSGR